MKLLSLSFIVFGINLTACYDIHQQHLAAPRILDGYAECWWNPTYQNYVWSFDVLTSHPEGSSEISDVFIDIYQGPYIGTLYLSPDSGGYWSLVIDEFNTPLWCGDWYEMEAVAYDWDGDWDSLTLTPDY